MLCMGFKYKFVEKLSTCVLGIKIFFQLLLFSKLTSAGDGDVGKAAPHYLKQFIWEINHHYMLIVFF